MTKPTRRVNRGRNHSYYLDAAPVDGVTTILRLGWPKPALTGWAARTVAEYCAEHPRQPDQDVDTYIGDAKKAPDRDRDRAARRGTEVHHLAERLADADAGAELEIPDELAGHIDAYLAFVADFAPDYVANELAVFSRAHRYAGTFDFVARIDAIGEGATLVDIKTNRTGPFGEVALQLAAYRWADFYVDDAGAEIPLTTLDIRHAAVLWLTYDGYELRPVDTGPDVFRQFLYVQQVAEASRTVGDRLGHPVAVTGPLALELVEAAP